MTQPQNPQSPPLLARFSVNNDGLDLLQVLNSGSGVIWRLNQFQAIWYVGSGSPIFIPGELPGNLYLDNSTGNIWQLQLDFTWLELPAPGGGGGGGVTSLNSLTGVINIIAGSGIGTSVVGNNIDVFNTGVLTVNSIAGSPTISAGAGITVNTSGTNINVLNSGLLSLNAITGAATAAAGTGISITPSGSTLTFGNTGVLSLNAITGNPVLGPGAGISITPSGSTLNIANTGVVSLNGLSGNPSIIPGSGTTVNVTGGNIQISASGTGRTPWVDIQNFGSIPKRFAFNQPTASATTTASSPSVTISSGTFSSALTNGQGVCIWKAGAATAQSTPSAPTITSPAVQGSQIITYKCVGYDSGGGLTAASASGTVTNAPAVFSPLPVAISSISLTSNVVTVNFASPLNTTVTIGMTIHIVGVTGAGSSWNGIWTIVSAPSTSQITYAFTGADGTGTVSAGSTGRVSNTQSITVISRASNGLITITTGQTHNYQVGSSRNPTIILIENCTPTSLNGWYTIVSASGTNITCSSGIQSAVTGSVTLGSSTCTVWEFITVACPALSGTTAGYYIYSDSYSPGSSLQLVGRCVAGEVHFTDWGQCFIAGYGAPGYVPTTPPVAAQNQRFTSTVLSGAGTNNLVLANNVPTSIPALGATIMYDDGPNLVAAAAAAGGNTSIGGSVFISPPGSNSNFDGYIFNSPITLPENVNFIFGCHCIINETMTFTAFNQISALFGQNLSTSISFCQRNYCLIDGIANPMMLFGENSGNTGGIDIDGLGFINNTNGTCALQLQSVFYCKVSNCAFTASSQNSGNAIGIILNGSCSLSQLDSLNFTYKNRFATNGVVGQSNWGPPIGALWFRGSDNPAIPNNNDNSSQVAFTGKHSANGRGVLFDHNFSNGNASTLQISVKDKFWMQDGNTPVFMFWGDIFSDLEFDGILNDTSITSIVANWAVNMRDVSLINSGSPGTGYPVATGSFINNLSSSGNSLQTQPQFQRVMGISFTTTASATDTISVPNCVSSSPVLLTPTNATAAADVASGNVYVASKGSQQVTIAHSAISGMTFDLIATVGN